jgi:hypothetical protein
VNGLILGIFHFFRVFLESIARTKNNRSKKKPELSFTPDMSYPRVCHERNYSACRLGAGFFTGKNVIAE